MKLGNHLSHAQDERSISEGHNLFVVGGREEHCLPMSPGRFEDDPVDLPSSSDIDALSGFIEQEDGN